jgi:hypothetical protein
MHLGVPWKVLREKKKKFKSLFEKRKGPIRCYYWAITGKSIAFFFVLKVFGVLGK